MDWKRIDLNLLVVFQTMLDARSVTRAGEVLGLSQPAMSAALARLRDLFDDPLFVRVGRQMEPTARAQELVAPVRQALDAIASDVFQRKRFEPAKTDKRFTIVTPDIGEVNNLPSLLSALAQVAPGASVRTISRTPQATGAALESGEADMALGHFPDLERPGFFRQKLFEEPFVCLVRAQHPTIGDSLSRSEFLSASLAVVRPDGRGRDVEDWLTPEKTPRRVVVEVAHFMSLLPILEGTDLVAVVPREFADNCARYAHLRSVPLPFKSPVLRVNLFWHERYHRDPAHAWFRGLIKQTLASAHEL